jgi:protein-disulfide isomerase
MANDHDDQAEAAKASDAAGDDHEAAPVAKLAEKSSFISVLGILGFLAALAGGFYIGQWIREGDPAPFQGYEDRTRYKVELSGSEPQAGPDDALVTIIEFSDYECPFCRKAHEPLMDALDDHDDVRLVFKHYPLPMHPHAIPAARAAWAAQQQGKFWEMHEHLFEVGGKLDDIEQVAERMGLDVARFRSDMTSEAAAQALEADRYAAGLLGIGSTPHFVINGRHLRGALAREHWDQVIESERSEAEQLLEQGTPRSGIYARLMEDALVRRAKPRQDSGPDPSKRHAVPAGEGRPSLGPDDAPITVVEFSDFQCPFCAKLAPTIHDLPGRHADVRVVFRQLPLQNHAAALPAARATLAAHRQGKFWELHDALFAREGKIDEDDLDDIAEEVGLDVQQWERDREDPEIQRIIDEDLALAKELGVRGTPATFVNGMFLGGAQPAEAFDAVIAAERTNAGTPAQGGGG